MTDTLSDHLDQALSDPTRRRRFAQNRVIVDTAVALNKALAVSGLNQKQLAQRLGKTEGFVSQVLGGGANMTLRTLGDLAFGLDCFVQVTFTQDASVGSMNTPRPLWNQSRSTPVKSSTVNTRSQPNGSDRPIRGTSAEGRSKARR